MSLKRILLIAIICAISFIPFLTTGCGSDDTTLDKEVGVYTIGPGNLEKFPDSTTASTK